MARFKLDRRAFLGGTSGVAVSLPFLEIMGEGKARAATPAPKRFLVCYAGISLTVDGGGGIRYLQPPGTGPTYVLPPEMSPFGKVKVQGAVREIQAYDVQNEVTVVSGLKIPWRVNGGAMPAGGREAQFHQSTICPMLTGRAGGGLNLQAQCESADQIVADAAASYTPNLRFPKGLQLQIQQSQYEGSNNGRGDIAFRKDSLGRAYPVALERSPQAAFNSIFTNFEATSDTEAQKQARKILREQDKSILDLVLRRSDRLKASLGKPDQVRLEQHFDEIRALELRVSSTATVQGGAECKELANPGADPRSTADPMATAEHPLGWSNEIRRAEVMRDLMCMSFTCDLARSGVLLITYAQSYLSCKNLSGTDVAVHTAGHGGVALEDHVQRNTQVVAWTLEQVAYMVRKMKDTIDVDGRPLIDNTVILYGTEGGVGFDPESGVPEPGAHSSENMSVLVAGGRGLGLTPGRHIPLGNKVHPASVFVSAMKAVGVDKQLGDITNGIPGPGL